MQRIALVGALLAFAIVPSALSAQQATPDQQTPATQPSPPSSSSPPPFPPFERAPSHRWVDVGNHHSGSSRHHAVTKHRKTVTESRHAKTAAESRHKRHERRATKEERAQPVVASKRTIRRCHNMTYTQIMKESTCRALMKQDIDGGDHRHAHASRHKSRRQQQATHSHAKKHHRHD